MLVRDENWSKKQDEIKGEVEYNTKVVSPETHAKRNAFLNNNSMELLRQSGTALAGKSILCVGASMAEAECFSCLAGSTVGLDIVPDLVVAYRDASRRTGLNVEWIVGDGECLPYPAESFDVVIVRQALHRVARVGGKILVIEEPYSPPNLDHPAVAGNA